MSINRILMVITALAFAALLAGCQAPGQSNQPTVAQVIAETPAEYEQLWGSIALVLRKYDFELDRQDRLEGVIVTHPETSPHWFELWRRQPQNAYLWWESNLHTIQRQATVQIRPDDAKGLYSLQVQIDRYRYSLQERQIDNSAAAMRLYSSAAPTTSGKNMTAKESSDWVLLGRDEPMERLLLDEIVEKHGNVPLVEPVRAAPATQP